MKNCKKVLALILALAMCMALLVGCGGGTTTNQGENGVITVANSPDEVTDQDADKTPLGEASDFTFDFESLDYAFSGTENAEFYFIKVYPVVDGQESNSASFQSDKIVANESNSYSGTIEGETLLAGDYVAHVVASGTGYKSSDIQISGTSTLLAAAGLSANWNTDDPDDVKVDITITPGDDITTEFTLTITDSTGNTVYTNANATVEPIQLTAADLGAEALSVEDEYTVTVTVNPVDGYSLPAEGTSASITERMMFGPFM
jgi:hypothetical protein